MKEEFICYQSLDGVLKDNPEKQDLIDEIRLFCKTMRVEVFNQLKDKSYSGNEDKHYTMLGD